jgi:phosphoribosylformylglycinamidine synthase
MQPTVFHLYRRVDDTFEYCFNIQCDRELHDTESERLRLLLADGFMAGSISDIPTLHGDDVVEVGPRLNFATAWSANMVAICAAVGLAMITRLERSRRYRVPPGTDRDHFVTTHHDRMTECPYPAPLASFDTGLTPEPVYDIDLMGGGPEVLTTVPGLSMDEWDRQFYHDYFVGRHQRNPTIVEIMDLNNANSEHSRHGFFKGVQLIDGVARDATLFELVAATLEANPAGSVIAFKDNSSAINGYPVTTIITEKPGEPSRFAPQHSHYHPLLTAETHNFPTGVAPFAGAETGTGGRIRDVQATGRGAFVMAGSAGYCVGNLHIPNYQLDWELERNQPDNLADPLTILIEASNGASDYGNKFGEPVILGFVRSFDQRLPAGERWGFIKPIMFTSGIGQIDARLVEKHEPEPGMLIVQIGGPAYRVGFGGGAASSMLQGENVSDLDFDAVQRGDAEMEQKMNRVIRACCELGDDNPLEMIHDQGAGGPANVLKELVESAGGRIDIRAIRVGDPTMSVLEIYVAEYQERVGLLIAPGNLARFQTLCRREKVSCEVLGEVTGDKRFIVTDSVTGTTPVDLELEPLLGGIPQKTFADQRRTVSHEPLTIAPDSRVVDLLRRVVSLVSVGSKRFLTNKVDRAVTGLVAQQQCCGPLQLPVADFGVMAQTHFGTTGIATAIGEQSIKMLVNPGAGARMAVGEALTNLAGVVVEDINQIKCSANWMWAPKLAGEGSALRDAVQAMHDAMIPLGIGVDGGKDSLSMATMVGAETVKSPRQLVVSLYGAVPDIGAKITPDITEPGSVLFFIDCSGGRYRLGGSALAQVQGRIGDESPDMDDPALVGRAFGLIQHLVAEKTINAGHDRSDGGLITTLMEMAFSGNCGLDIGIVGKGTPVEMLFAEELGYVVACPPGQEEAVISRCREHEVPVQRLGVSTTDKQIRIRVNAEPVLAESMETLRGWWEETSHQLERLQMNPACADEEKATIFSRPGPSYHISFAPDAKTADSRPTGSHPKVAILRDEGSNSDREMSSAFYQAGFEVWDICMQDLLDGAIDLTAFTGLAAVGGFSYADVPQSAKGWGATIALNDMLHGQFTSFYQRPDTFSLGVCNGCQLFALIGWVPWLGLAAEKQPRFVRNRSQRFESRWVSVTVTESPAIMLAGMENTTFGIHVDHGEGRFHAPDVGVFNAIKEQKLIPLAYVDDDGAPTERYPFNPNGSPGGVAGLCSPDGRHLALMPHPERCFLPWQAHWLPEDMKTTETSPWFRLFTNAYRWCTE